MSKVPLSAAMGVLVASIAGAAPHYSYVGRPDDPVYFGHITHCELRGDEGDPKVVRPGQKIGEPAAANTPLLPGDTIATGLDRRCEAQFDTGTVVRLDGATQLRIETILAPALSRDSGVTNFLLAAGRVEIHYRHYAKNEVFQVLTPNAAVKLRDRAVLTIGLAADGSTGVEVQSGAAEVLFDRAGGQTRRRKVAAGQNFVFGPGHPGGERAEPVSAAVLDFRRWSDVRNREAPPKSEPSGSQTSPGLGGTPPVVVDFAARAQNWGTWVSSDIYGSVWRPRDNDRPGWRPYLEGRWAPIQDDLFWIADEPWGWVPYHLGFWTSLRGQGWVWVPGSWFAPAWVQWSPYQDLWGWRPFDVWDFYADDSLLASYGGDGGGGTTSPPARPPAHAVPRRPAPPSPYKPTLPPDRPRPREIQAITERMAKARGSSLSRLKDEAAVVRLSTVLLPGQAPHPEAKAEARSSPAAPGAALDSSPKPPQAQPAASSASVVYTPLLPAEMAFGAFPRARSRDWNPDAPLARALGGRLIYSSKNNAVVCVGCTSLLLRPSGGPNGNGASASSSGSSSTTSTSGPQGPAAPASPSATQSGGGRGGTFAGGNVRRDN